MTSGTFHGQVTGGFVFVGEHLTIPPLDLTVAPSSFSDLPKLVHDLVVAQAQTIFATFFQPANVAKWLSAVAANAIKSVADVGITLRDNFNQQTPAIGKAIRDTLGRGSQAAATSLKNLGNSADDVGVILPRTGGRRRSSAASAVPGAGFSHSEVSHALQVAIGIPHLYCARRRPRPYPPRLAARRRARRDPRRLRHGDIPALAIHANAHGDVPGHIHADAHGDVPGHIHADVHGDVPGHVHGDAHLRFLHRPPCGYACGLPPHYPRRRPRR